ncbi:MAG: hypothetical protein QM820_29360 [Minicystis sp.]
MFTRSVVPALLVGGFVSALLAACAQGQQLTGGAGGSGPGVGGSTSSGSAGGMPEAGPPGVIGSPCKSNADCTMGSCAPIGNASYCTQPCPPECPDGTYCTVVNGTSLCAPDLDQQCTKCSATTDCKLPSDQCLTAPLGDKFCARDCSIDGLCPNGFTCVDKDGYTNPADGGAPDGGDAGAADGGKPATTAYKWCVPNSGSSCPCNQKRDGVAHACVVKNDKGACTGMETCNGKQGKWEGCTAATPAAETCNGKDDNCNGMPDDGDPNALCASAGPKPPHASWACKSAACTLGACDPGWTSYPAGPASAGCACPLETGEPNGTCGAATPAGAVNDTGGAPLTITGTLSSAADVDFWSFDAVDIDEGSTNSYHVSIAFTAPAPNDEFMMDVMRDTCTDTPTGPASNIIAYDWCVNGFDGANTGEAPCGPASGSHCGGTPGSQASGTHTAKYYVRVYRRPGATGTCSQYTLMINGGGGACDFTKKCP